MPTKPPFRILVVDDDALSRELLALLLTCEGYVVETAESGDAALAALHRQHTAPGAVLVDLQMPGLSGSGLAHRLRDTCSGATRIIAMSASDSAGGALEGFDGFLPKPFTMEVLATALADSPSTPPSGNPIRQTVTVLDHTIYSRLADSMRQESVDQLYALCLMDTKRREALMRQAAGRGDDIAYRREAHAIKGGCGMVGAVEMQTLAASMEDSGIPANYVATLDEFLLACDRLQRMLIARKTVADRNATAEVVRRSHA